MSPDHSVRVQTERLLLEQQFGKPHQQVEHSGEVAAFMLEIPKPLTRDEWLRAHASEVANEEPN